MPDVDVCKHPRQVWLQSSQSTLRRGPAGGANQRVYM